MQHVRARFDQVSARSGVVNRPALRFGPWLLTALAAVLVLAVTAVDRGDRPGGDTAQTLGVLSATPPPGLTAMRAHGAHGCLALACVSGQAAALTGSLALVGADRRPARAVEVAREVRALAREAAQLDETLAGVLADLADALDAYARGDPEALAKVRDGSARNAELRSRYRSCAFSSAATAGSEVEGGR
jgi:hypothetical protein